MNGIFENYVELRAEVAEHGHELDSETDTEALVHLLADAYDGDLVEAVRRVYPRLEGHFAFLAIARDEPDPIVAVRLAWPPLVVGKGEAETFIASFLPAFIAGTRQMQHVAGGRDRRDPPGRRDLLPSPACPPSCARWSRPTRRSRSPRRAATRRSCSRRSTSSRARSPTRSASGCRDGALSLDGIGLSDAELAEVHGC